MNAVTNAISEVDQNTLEDTLARYDVGVLLRYWPAPNGIENSNYFIRTHTGEQKREFVLTILEQPSNSGPAYVPLLDTCRDAGLPVAPVLRNQAGSAFDSLDGKSTLLTPRLPGRHVYNPTVKQVHEYSSTAFIRVKALSHNPEWRLGMRHSVRPRPICRRRRRRADAMIAPAR